MTGMFNCSVCGAPASITDAWTSGVICEKCRQEKIAEWCEKHRENRSVKAWIASCDPDEFQGCDPFVYAYWEMEKDSIVYE